MAIISFVHVNMLTEVIMLPNGLLLFSRLNHALLLLPKRNIKHNVRFESCLFHAGIMGFDFSSLAWQC